MSSVAVFDPTISDSLSKVRGIGRYLQLLHEAFANEFLFTGTINTLGADILINPFFDLLKPPLTLKRAARKQVAVIHDLIPLKYPSHFPAGIRGNINTFLNKLCLKNYDHIVTDSQASKADIVEMLGINEKNISVIYPPINSVFYEKPKGQKPELDSENYFMYVGDATWNKNLVNLARAVRIADVSCVFVGNVFSKLSENLSHPWQQELKEFASVTAGSKRFVFPGFISDEELIQLYKNAVANLLISRDEGFGFSYFEAASQGTPSVLSNIPIFQETAGNTALFVNENDPDEIAKELRSFIENRKERNRLGKAAQARAKTTTLHRFKEEWLNVISEVSP